MKFSFARQNCKYLERMDLEECSQITDLTLAHLATGCPSLEKLVRFRYFLSGSLTNEIFLHPADTLTLRTDNR